MILLSFPIFLEFWPLNFAFLSFLTLEFSGKQLKNKPVTWTTGTYRPIGNFNPNLVMKI